MGNEIFLKPGEYYIGDSNVNVKTILGSCVSVVLQDFTKNILFINHCLLAKNISSVSKRKNSDGMYVDGSFAIFSKFLRENKLRAGAFSAGVYGGGHLIGGNESNFAIGQRNIEMAYLELSKLKISVASSDTGGHYFRKLSVDGNSGAIDVTRQLSHDLKTRSMTRKDFYGLR